MPANSSLSLTSLDFDTLKSNFIDFLKSQSNFKDYNYTGSNINVFLDVLSYNSYLNTFYLNMVASEMFNDSAQKLDSVISHAKELNYLPRSTRSSVASVSFTVDTVGTSNPLIVPKGTIFSGQNSNNNFTFITNEDTTYTSSNTYVDGSNVSHIVYNVANLAIYEGSYIQDSFVMDYTQQTQLFTLSNPNIDTTSLSVIVQENGTNTVYEYAENLYGLTSNSQVFFIQATANSQYQILFGDGVFGYVPLNGDVIYTQYRISNGSDGNGIASFNIDQNIGILNGGSSINSILTTVSPSIGGANSETIESIRFNAPRHFQTQGRCITSSDYITTITQNFPEVEYVNVFSSQSYNGSENYGTVYISPSTYSGTILTNSRKADIQSFLNNLSPIGINVSIIDPDYLFITLNTLVHVNFSNTISTSTTVISEVISAIQIYNTTNLQNFNTAFRMSRLENIINNCDVGILSNETSAKIYKIYSPTLNIPYAISCVFNNKIIPGSLISTSFVSNGQNYVISDVAGNDAGSGTLYQVLQNSSTPSYTAVGTIDYITGTININQIVYNNIGGGIKIIVTPQNQDIYCYNNTIIEIDTTEGLTINTVQG